MAFNKTTFVDNQTIIDADTLNAIQDELVRVGADKSMGLSGLAADDQIMVSAVDADGKPTSWRKKYRDMLNVRDFGAKGDTTAAAATTCVADQITASSFRLRTNGSSRCWANGSPIRWIALAL